MIMSKGREIRSKLTLCAPLKVICLLDVISVVCLLSTSYVNINPTLCDCLLDKSEYQEVEYLKWDDLFSR